MDQSEKQFSVVVARERTSLVRFSVLLLHTHTGINLEQGQIFQFTIFFYIDLLKFINQT